MSRHTDNLERLHNRFQLLFGPEDELTLSIGSELVSQSHIEPKVRNQNYVPSRRTLHKTELLPNDSEAWRQVAH
jgi:hypothetical protein